MLNWTFGEAVTPMRKNKNNSVVLVRQHDRYSTEVGDGRLGVLCHASVKRWFGRRGGRLLLQVRTRRFKDSVAVRFLKCDCGHMYALPRSEGVKVLMNIKYALTPAATRWILARFKFSHMQTRTLYVRMTPCGKNYQC